MERGPLEYLFSLEQFGIKFGLENIAALLDAFGHPERSFHTLHVAGTNGKGSVTAMAEAMLRAAGYRTGRYTSPHLVDVTERFTIDGLPVSRATLELAAADLKQTIDALCLAGTLAAPPTFFEATTTLALEMFRRARVEVAVCEVGLGGRLDATNVLRPVATAITSIGFDHQQYLGTTLEAIAREKAGIIKPGVPVVVGRMAADARSAILQIADSLGAPVIDATDTTAVQDRERQRRVRLSTPRRDYGTVEVALAGSHQIENARVAVCLVEAAAGRGLEAPADAIVRGLETVSWPGRLEHRRLHDGRQILLDASHNPQGAQALAAYLKTTSWNRAPLVFAAMKDKDTRGMLSALVPAVGALVLTRASNPRSVEPAELAAQARALDPQLRITTAADPPAALAAAWSLSTRIVAAGSIFLLGDVMKQIDGA